MGKGTAVLLVFCSAALAPAGEGAPAPRPPRPAANRPAAGLPTTNPDDDILVLHDERIGKWHYRLFFRNPSSRSRRTVGELKFE